MVYNSLRFACRSLCSFQQSSQCSSNYVWSGHWEGREEYYLELVKDIQSHIQMLWQGLSISFEIVIETVVAILYYSTCLDVNWFWLQVRSLLSSLQCSLLNISVTDASNDLTKGLLVALVSYSRIRNIKLNDRMRFETYFTVFILRN